jgi:hypothetical protein
MKAGEAWCKGEKSRRVLLRTLPKLSIVLAGVANGNASAIGKRNIKGRHESHETMSSVCLQKMRESQEYDVKLHRTVQLGWHTSVGRRGLLDRRRLRFFLCMHASACHINIKLCMRVNNIDAKIEESPPSDIIMFHDQYLRGPIY